MAETEREAIASQESIEALEAAFVRLLPIVREQLRALAERMHPEMRAAGMQVLRVVLRAHRLGEGPVSIGDIITQTAQDKSVVSRQIRQLGEWRLITTRRAEQDRRVILVEPTQLALERSAAARNSVRMLNTRILATWPEGDVLELARLIDRLVTDRAED